MRLLLLLSPLFLSAQGMLVQPFTSEVRTVYDAGDVLSVAVDASGTVWAATRVGLVRWRNGTSILQARDTSIVAASGADVWFASRGALWRTSLDSLPRRVANLPAAVRHILPGPGTSVLVSTAAGLFRLSGDSMVREAGLPDGDVRQAAGARDGRIAAATASGLFLRREGGSWERVLPKSGNRSWAPDDVRGVAFDSMDRLWFASPQGAGC